MPTRSSALFVLAVILVAPGIASVLYAIAAAQDPATTEPLTKPRAALVNGFGAIGDGTTDDTIAIQKAVDAGLGQVRFPAGTYRLTKTIMINLDTVGPTAVIADGAVTVVMEGDGPAFHFVGTHDGTADPKSVKPNVWQRQRMPTIDGIEILGRHPNASGIQATKTMQLTITRVAVRDALHGIHLTTRNRNVIISECHLYDNRGVGIFYDEVNLHQSNITNTHVSYNDAGGIVIRGGDVRNVHIGTCDIEGNMGDEDAPATANVLLDSTGGSIGEIAITGCTIQHSHLATNSANIRINGQSTARPFTSERRHGNITIANNVLSDTQFNIDVANTRGVTIAGNTIWKGYTSNLQINNSEQIAISGNTFDRNPRYHYGDGPSSKNGVTINRCRRITFDGNQVDAGPVASVSFSDCELVNITDCVLTAETAPALNLSAVSDSRVSDCIVKHQGDGGSPAIQITGGNGGMIVDNRIIGETSVDAKAQWTIHGNIESK